MAKRGNEPEEPGQRNKNSCVHKMRIAIPSFFYKPAGGGIARYVDTLAKIFSEMGHYVDIITASYNGKKTEREGNITIYRLPCMNIFDNPEDNKEKSRDFLRFLKRYSKKNPDVFLAQSFHTIVSSIGHVLALNMVSMQTNIPIILNVHSFIQEDKSSDLKFQLIHNLYWDKVVCIGSHLAESIFKRGISTEMLKSTYPPVDLRLFRPDLGSKWLRSRVDVSNEDFLILHASRIDNYDVAESKGVFVLLKALSMIKEKNVKLIISAAPCIPQFEESKRETIKKIIDTGKLLGIENRVFVETFDPSNMPFVYNGCDLCVLVSDYENCPLALSEAMACGLPVIGSTIGGIPEIIDSNKSGILISPNDSVRLSEEIMKVIKNRKKMREFGEVGRHQVEEKQAANKICRSLLGLCESVICKKKVN